MPPGPSAGVDDLSPAAHEDICMLSIHRRIGWAYLATCGMLPHALPNALTFAHHPPPSLQFDSLNGIECAIDVDWYFWGSLLQGNENYYEASENLSNVVRLYNACGVAATMTESDYATYNGSAPQSCAGIDLSVLEMRDLLNAGCAAASSMTCPVECAQALAQVCYVPNQAGGGQPGGQPGGGQQAAGGQVGEAGMRLHLPMHTHVPLPLLLPLPLPLQLNNNFQCVYEIASLNNYCLTSYMNSDAGEVECGFYGFGVDQLSADDEGDEMMPDWIKPAL